MKAYIKKIECYLPEIIEETPKERLKKRLGINSRHVCPDGEIASDIAVKAAEKLFANGVDRNKIDYLLLCIQTPDYFLPTTACIVQDRLGLSKNIGAMDYSLGCSGFVYGLGLAKGLIETGQAKNVLLLTTAAYCKYINKKDGAVRPLIGDGAAATLISAEYVEKEGISGFVYGTDGTGAGHLILPVGGMKYPPEETPFEDSTDKYGNYRTNRNVFMSGAGIMEFSLENVPGLVDSVLEKNNLSREEVDYFVFHQASRIILENLRIKCGLENRPYWMDMAEYGNTVASTIPIALRDMMIANPDMKLEKVMLAGFGVGLSWSGCIVDLSKVIK